MEQVVITDDDVVYRRLLYESTYPPESKKLSKPPGAVSPAAFIAFGNPMQQISVELKRLTTLEDCIERGRPGQGVAELTVVDIRAIGLDVLHTPNGLTIAHCDIVHPVPSGRIERMPHCRALAGVARVVHPPAPPVP